MKNIFLSASILLFAFISCKKQQSQKYDKSTNSEVGISKFSIDSVKVNDSIEVSNNLISAFQSKVLLFPSIEQKSLLDSIYKPANIQLPNYSKENILQELTKQKQTLFDSTRAGTKDLVLNFKQTWNDISDMKIVSHKNDFLILNYINYTFTGGAHGYQSEIYKVFDLKNNSTIQLKDIVYYPKIDWNKILMESFKKNVSKDQQAILLEKVIPVKNNFYFDDRNIYFVYNQYEIAAYAAGRIVIPISWETFNGNISPEFKKRIGIK